MKPQTLGKDNYQFQFIGYWTLSAPEGIENKYIKTILTSCFSDSEEIDLYDPNCDILASIPEGKTVNVYYSKYLTSVFNQENKVEKIYEKYDDIINKKIYFDIEYLNSLKNSSIINLINTNINREKTYNILSLAANSANSGITALIISQYKFDEFNIVMTAEEKKAGRKVYFYLLTDKDCSKIKF